MLRKNKVAVIGAGPAGLMAAEVLVQGGVQVDLYDAMPSVGRKFLMAGKGGLNLTHAEGKVDFITRYGERSTQVAEWLDDFDGAALRAWAKELGVDTFIGSSGRVFPTDMKAAPLLRAWLHRLRTAGATIHVRHKWMGWNAQGEISFSTPHGEVAIEADAVVLALGGGSWAKLGSDGAWVPLLAARGVSIAPLKPANCGFEVNWSEHFRNKFAGFPLKNISASHCDASGETLRKAGEFVISNHGVEGSLIYALSTRLRDALQLPSPLVGRAGNSGSTASGPRSRLAVLSQPWGTEWGPGERWNTTTTLHIDLTPAKSLQQLITEIAHPRGARSMASHLQSRAGISGVKAGLLRECASKEDYADPARLAAAIKALPITLTAARPLDEAISTAGGVSLNALDQHLMLRELPGVFCAGEMLDWEAPTGGYLLQASFATGAAAGKGVLTWLGEPMANSE